MPQMHDVTIPIVQMRKLRLRRAKVKQLVKWKGEDWTLGPMPLKPLAASSLAKPVHFSSERGFPPPNLTAENHLYTSSSYHHPITVTLWSQTDWSQDPASATFL